MAGLSATASSASASTMPDLPTMSNGDEKPGSHRFNTRPISPSCVADTTHRHAASGSACPKRPKSSKVASTNPATDSASSTAFNEWYAGIDGTPSALGRRKLPLRLVGDGTNGRFHDTSAGLTTLHSRESLADLAKATDLSDISELRFRSNIAIQGCTPWQELTWPGNNIQIGGIQFRVRKTVTRCLATHVEPQSGQRDIDIMGTLTRIIGQPEPQFAISLVAKTPGTIHIGDEVRTTS